jgi:hypothetical protein
MSPRRRMPVPRLYLTRRGKLAIYGVFGAVWGSGVLWLIFHYFLQAPGEFGVEANPIEHPLLMLHGAAAFAALLLGGWLWKAHVAPWWDSPNRRHSGVALIAFGAVLIVSGWLLYYAGGDTLRAWTALLHWSIGLALALPLLVHALRSGRYRQSADATRSARPRQG